MTFKDLQRLIESQPGQGLGQLQKLRGKPFWIWDKTRHKEKSKVYKDKGECCMQHIIGLPKKEGIEKPFYDYQKELYRAVMIPGYLNSDPKLRSVDPKNILYPFKEKHLWVKKALAWEYLSFFSD